MSYSARQRQSDIKKDTAPAEGLYPFSDARRQESPASWPGPSLFHVLCRIEGLAILEDAEMEMGTRTLPRVAREPDSATLGYR